MTILLVTGSRSLARDHDAASWGRETVAHAIVSLPPGSLVVTGDAPGPDQWAHDAVCSLWLAHASRGLHVARWGLDGWVQRAPLGRDEDGRFRWATSGPPAPRDRRWPLVRNEAMVAWVAGRTPGPATCLALIDPGSRTRGTEHTARLAELNGIAVRREVWRP